MVTEPEDVPQKREFSTVVGGVAPKVMLVRLPQPEKAA
jgi:hypothetical protein